MTTLRKYPRGPKVPGEFSGEGIAVGSSFAKQGREDLEYLVIEALLFDLLLQLVSVPLDLHIFKVGSLVARVVPKEEIIYFVLNDYITCTYQI